MEFSLRDMMTVIAGESGFALEIRLEKQGLPKGGTRSKTNRAGQED
jgi:hypothetical protein